MLDILIAGDLYSDLIMTGFHAWPQPGTEAFATGFRREIGGGPPITACGMAKLGSRAAVLSVLGHDGRWIADRLLQNGVETQHLRFEDSEVTGTTVAISTPQDRTFFTYPGANRFLIPELFKILRSNAFAGARHIHLACAPPLDSTEELLGEIHRNGCTVSLDTGWHPDWLADPRALALLPRFDLFFPNEPEAEKMTGSTDPEAALRAFEAAGAKRVALKLGEKGAMLLWDGQIFSAGPYPVKPRDTTGAGDCFNAGFLHFWLRGEDPQTCLRAACFCGAASTEAIGGIEGFPDLSRVNQAISYKPGSSSD